MVTWTAADRTMLRTLFTQPTGRKLLELLKSKIPKIKAKSMEEATIEALKKQGAEDIVNYFISMAEDMTPELKEGVDYRDLSIEGD